MEGIETSLASFRRGEAFVDLSGWTKVLVRGPDARAWLNDLVTADVAALSEGRSARSLLLTPTGKLRAAFTMARLDEGFLLVQDPRQPESVAGILSPYVLSSEVAIEDVTGGRCLLAFPAHGAPDVTSASTYAPSALWSSDPPVGADLLGPAHRREEIRRATGRPEATEDDVETVRIERGIPRFPVDLDQRSLPHEAGLDRDIASKGCFLGQEAVARVANLGHPPFLVRALRATSPVAPGEVVLAQGREAGRVTSAVSTDGGAAVIARVRWGVDGPLATGSGTPLQPSAGAGPA